MNRGLAVSLRTAAIRFALLLLILAVSSCGKDSVPVAPGASATSTKGAPSLAPPTSVISEAIVALQPGVSLSTFLANNNLGLISDLDVPAAGAFPQTTYYLVKSDDGSPLDTTGFLESEVSYRSPHLTVWMPEDDRDGLSFDDHHTWRSSSQYLSQPAISQVDILAARLHSEGYGSVIALLDTGVDANHPLFSPKRFTAGGNYTVFPPTAGMAEPVGDDLDGDDDGWIDEGVGHGTHVAGIIYTGARQAKMRVYKVLDDEGRGSSFGLAKAIKNATDAGVHIINLSLGLEADNRMLHHVIAHATSQGIVVVASAGNRNNSEIQYPAGYDEVVSVAAVDAHDVKADFASYGATVDIAAPGTDIVSAIPSSYGAGVYAAANGSSMAAPFVSAAIAIVRSRWQTTSALAANSVLHTATNISAANPTFPGMLGTGRVNFNAAVEGIPIEGEPQE